MTGMNRGDQATYSCDVDFVLEGGAVRICIDPGIWNGTEPTCKGICYITLNRGANII